MLSALGPAANRWACGERAKTYVLSFRVPKDLKVRASHFAAARAAHHAAVAWVQWADDHLQFVVQVPRAAAAAPVAGALDRPRKRKRENGQEAVE